MKFKIPLWKKFVSWFYPINIEKVKSPINKELQVNLQYGSLVIDSIHANYSYGNLHTVFQEAIHHLRLNKNQEYKVLILGFGAGSIANILIHENQLKCTITGIELDRKVTKLSNKYFFIDKLENTTVLNKDAFEFINETQEDYDLVFVDLFIDTEVPEQFQSQEFLKHIKRILKPNGQILMNSMENTSTLIKNWQQVFDNHHQFSIQDNQVLHYIKNIR